MPKIDASSYRSPWFLKGPHMETIAPNLTRRRLRVRYRRSRLELSDGDFVDLDTAVPSREEPSATCVLTLHGLEGSSSAPYVKSWARSAMRQGFAVVAMNQRGCSGEMNRLARFYHSGETGDLSEAIEHLACAYESIALLGFSLGGNVVLKYLGERPKAVHPKVRAGVAISAPVDLAGSASRIGHPSNRFYMRRFVRLLSAKIERKAELYPELIDPEGCRRMRDFHAFDGAYTAPLNKFASAEDYWQRCSSLNWLADIDRPALIINARNDPFLSPSCFPEDLAKCSDTLYSCFPDEGGHLGFPGLRVGGSSWHEAVALDFLEERCGSSKRSHCD